MTTIVSRFFSLRCRPAILAGLLCGFMLTGISCNKGKSVDESTKGGETAPAEPLPSTVDLLRKDLGLKEGEGKFEVVDGWIVVVDLEKATPKTLKPIARLPMPPVALPGQPTQLQLRLNYTSVTDLSDLADSKITHLNLQGTPVSDISLLKSLPLNTLWLNDTKVTDISPLKGKSLESLDLTGTQVKDLSPLAGMKTLRRLNLEKCAVTDLSPLQDLELQRIIFDPKKITKGIETVRNMLSLQAMHVTFPKNPNDFLRPDEFWAKYGDGK